MVSNILANIVSNVFVMWGVMWLVNKVRSETDIYIQLLISFFIMMALYLWRVI